jgi:hypothetical protein
LTPWLDPEGLEVFRQCLADCKDYVEYGCGRSTLFALSQSTSRVVAVESCPGWAREIQVAAAHHAARLDLVSVDIGEVGPFGSPVDYSRRGAFWTYIDSPWRRAKAADLVLVDGRFRVACFCRSLLAAPPHCTLLFDDYLNRRQYHVVEEIIKPTRFAGRMAVFHLPMAPEIDHDAASRMALEFAIVKE